MSTTEGQITVFLLDDHEVVRRGVPLSIFGPVWRKAREWPLLQPHYRAEYLDGDSYAYAVQCAKVSLGMLSKGNRDLHTTRSMEIPALGGLLCAERTEEHLALYRDGEEAMFWSDSAECARACQALLADEPRRQRIAACRCEWSIGFSTGPTRFCSDRFSLAGARPLFLLAEGPPVESS